MDKINRGARELPPRNIAPPFDKAAGDFELIGDPVYDRFDWPYRAVNAARDSVTFFTRAEHSATGEQNNLYGLPYLPAPQWFYTTGFQLIALGSKHDIKELRRWPGYFEFIIGSKQYAQIAPLDVLFSKSGEFLNAGGPYEVVPLFIPPQQNFMAQLRFPSAPFAPLFPLTLFLYMKGWRFRPVA